MKIKNITPNIIQLKFYQEKTDNDYGSCLWGNVIIDCVNYTLFIESDCGSYAYGWTPTPNTESFIRLLCRMSSDYLLGKISDMTYFDFDKSKEQTYKNIREYFEYDGANEAQEIIETLDYNLDSYYYWTNLKPNTELDDTEVYLNDILDSGWSDRKKARCLAVIDSRPNSTPVKMFHRYYSTGFTTLIFKDEKHYHDCVREYEKLSGGKRKIAATELDNYAGCIFDGVRYMNQNELEKCQCVPEGYTKCLSRNEAADVLGDGWNIDVITWFFNALNIA